jgi:hypothetical protein
MIKGPYLDHLNFWEPLAIFLYSPTNTAGRIQGFKTLAITIIFFAYYATFEITLAGKWQRLSLYRILKIQV